MKTMKRFLVSVIVLTLVLECTGDLPLLGSQYIYNVLSKAIAEIAPQEVLSPVWSIGEEGLGEAKTSGKWTYALRNSDGYAVILGYRGNVSTLEVPARIGGIDVVGIAANALDIKGLESVSLSGNVTWISDDAFGAQKPNIHALNGSYGLYFASTHGMQYTNDSEADFDSSVIDLSDVFQSRIRTIDKRYFVINNLEASRLHVGDVIWLKESDHQMPCLERVSSLVSGSNQTEVYVEGVDYGTYVINYEYHQVIKMGEGDFVPCEGVTYLGTSSNSTGVSRVADHLSPQISPVDDVGTSGDLFFWETIL